MSRPVACRRVDPWDRGIFRSTGPSGSKGSPRREWVLFAVTPYLLYKIYPPEIKESPNAPLWAGEELRKLGSITWKEIRLLVLVTVALGIWVGAGKYIDATLGAILVVVLMVVLGVVSWNDVLSNGEAWNVLVWYATLVTMASGLAETKFVNWVAQSLAPAVSNHGATVTIVLVAGSFCLLHYLFASGSAHVKSR